MYVGMYIVYCLVPFILYLASKTVSSPEYNFLSHKLIWEI